MDVQEKEATFENRLLGKNAIKLSRCKKMAETQSAREKAFQSEGQWQTPAINNCARFEGGKLPVSVAESKYQDL